MASSDQPDAGAISPVVVETPEGAGRLFVTPAPEPWAVLFLGHGAGGGVEAVDLSVLARRLPDQGISVVRFEQPWRTAGGRVAVRAPRLDLAWNAALVAVLDGEVAVPGAGAGLPVLTGGRSAGARVACRTAADGPLAGRVSGVVACAFPLHLPGRPERSREAELLAPACPRLVLQGERDSFGSAAEVAAVLAACASEPAGDLAGDPDGDLAGDRVAPEVHLVPVPGADHSMKVARAAPFGPALVRDLLVQSTVVFCRAVASPTGNTGVGVALNTR